MKIEDYQKEWECDSKIDGDSLDEESLKIPQLHSKWLKFFSDERLIYKKLLRKKEEQVQILTDYYSGLIDGKDIGRPPWQYKTETKSAIQKRVETDKVILKLQELIDEKEEIILFIKEVVTSINFRNNTIGNAIKFKQWTQGSLM